MKKAASEIHDDFELPGKQIEDENFTDSVNQQTQGGIGKAGVLVSFAQNPTGMLVGLLSAVPVVGAIVSIMTFALTLPQTINAFVDILKDKRIMGVFKRDILNEVNPYLTREQQQLRRLGEDQVIFSQNQGFSNAGGILSTNTLSQVRANGISDIGLRDKAMGVY